MVKICSSVEPFLEGFEGLRCKVCTNIQRMVWWKLTIADVRGKIVENAQFTITPVEEFPLSFLVTLGTRVEPGTHEGAKALMAGLAKLRQTYPSIQFDSIEHKFDPLNNNGFPGLCEVLVYAENQEFTSETRRKVADERVVRRLDISTQCQNAFGGSWLCPAILTDTQSRTILENITDHRKEWEALSMLLLIHCNNPDMFIKVEYVNVINEVLKNPVDYVYYRLASGTDGSRRRSQLWQVKPPVGW